MRRWQRLSFAILFPALLAAEGLQIVRPVLSDSDGGPPNPPSANYRPGDSLFFQCRIAGFTKDKEEVRLSYVVQAVDSNNIPLTEPYKNSVKVEVAAQDKEWMPKVETSISIPSLLFAGDYKITIKAEDLVAKTSTDFAVPFHVRGREDIKPSDSLAVQAFRFLRSEDDEKPAERSAYKPGDHLWAKFDITGFRYGPDNRVDVSYVTSIQGADGKTLWTQPQEAGEHSASFYPRAFVPATMGLELRGGVKPGEYTLVVSAKDAIGNQTYELKRNFTVE
jgi:hypothetical protein